MNRLFTITLTPLFLVLFSISSSSFALFDAQLAVGSRNAKVKAGENSSTLKGSEIQLSAHFSPIPLVPVAGGLYILKHDYEDDLTGTQVGLEAMAWLPFDVSNLTLYGKLGLGLTGAYDYKLEVPADSYTYSAKAKVASASKMGVGVKWNPLALVSLLAQVDYFTEKWDVDTTLTYVTTGPTKTSFDQTVNGTTLLIGVEVGI